jgi:primosomal protein N' (replication factor Y)
VTVALIARVLLDSPLPQLDRLFDYRIPPELTGEALPGVRVKVPLRSAGRVANGYIVELGEAGNYSGVLSDIDSVVSPVPVLTGEVWALARAAATRAAGNASDIVRLAIPPRHVRIEKAWLNAMASDEPPAPGPLTVDLGAYPGLDKAIEHHSRLAVDAVPLVEKVGTTSVGAWAITMAAMAASALSRGESSILAVPDYRDQRQLVAALAAVIPERFVVHLDAKQANPDRYSAFLRCLEGHPIVAVGNRSVVYAPAHNLGLIAVWDDGDPLHSEPLSPYVHSRDAALVRQQQHNCALVFLGHSRSTEVERLVELGWLASYSPAPSVLPKVIPTAQQSSLDPVAVNARIPSTAWREAREALEVGPVLVQVARPGYAPRLACADCAHNARCAKCDGPLAKKSSRSAPACQWCGAIAAAWSCSNCGSSRLHFVGSGTGRTAEDLGRAFPGIRVIIADGEHNVLSVGTEPALVIATRGAEPIAEGGYRAVLLLDGETMVARESLRVGEDCLRWWSNAAALAARRAPVVLVGVGGGLASALATWRQADYVRRELAERRQLRFPPAVRVATVTGSLDAVSDAVASVAADDVDILGPVDIGEGTVRSIVRFDYNRGAEVADALRAEVVRSAAKRRKAFGPKSQRGSLAPLLKVRFDDVEPFLES